MELSMNDHDIQLRISHEDSNYNPTNVIEDQLITSHPNASLESTHINDESQKCAQSPYRIIHLSNLISQLDQYFGICNICKKNHLKSRSKV